MQNDREVRAREGVKVLRTNPKYGTDLKEPPVATQPAAIPRMQYPIAPAIAKSETFQPLSRDVIGNWPPKKPNVLKKSRPHTECASRNQVKQESSKRAVSSPPGGDKKTSTFPPDSPFELKEVRPRSAGSLK
jgi:hypothetical protein